jgi:carbonic anhydrase
MTRPSRGMNPSQAWAALRDGNGRFVRGEMQHPSQDAGQRAKVAAAQYPFAVIFGCSDSRVAAELVFDQGLGDIFVVRTAGHVVDTTVIGSIEYGVEIAGAVLVVVLGHDRCGAVEAANHSLVTGEMPPGFVRAVVDRVIPSIVTRPADRTDGEVQIADRQVLLREHVRNTVHMLHGYSASLAAAVAQGRCAIVGAEYALAEGRVEIVEALGDIGS